MSPELHAVLLAADVPDQLNGDPTTNYDALRKEIAEVKPSIEALVGFDLKVEENNEDAEFLVTWFIFEPGFYDESQQSGAHVYRFAVAFSAHARLATVFTNYWHGNLSAFPVKDFEDELTRRGFACVPSIDLAVPYSGSNKAHFRECTWWDRYFGYL